MTITRHPTNQWASVGAKVVSDVVLSSTAPPITYQWYGQGETPVRVTDPDAPSQT